MAELLWRLVLKINARAVFLFTLLLLCIVLVMLLHHGSRQGDGLKTAGHSVNSGPGTAPPGPPRVKAMPVDKIEDPFPSAFLVAWLDLEASRKREREATRAKLAVAPNPTAAPANPKPAPRPKQQPQKWVRVTYQGMISRTDGVHVALVSEMDGGTLHTLTAGDSLLGGRVKNISAERVMLVIEQDGTEQSLRAGVVSRVPKDSP